MLTVSQNKVDRGINDLVAYIVQESMESDFAEPLGGNLASSVFAHYPSTKHVFSSVLGCLDQTEISQHKGAFLQIQLLDSIHSSRARRFRDAMNSENRDSTLSDPVLGPMETAMTTMMQLSYLQMHAPSIPWASVSQPKTADHLSRARHTAIIATHELTHLAQALFREWHANFAP